MWRRRDILLLDLGGWKLDDVVVSTIMLERECTKEDGRRRVKSAITNGSLVTKQ